jgi:dihydrofolate reductase
MKVICSMVVTANGYIARPDGREDYASHEGWLEYLHAAKQYNNFVIGRKTLDIVNEQYDGFGFNDVECDYKVVVSSQSDLHLGSGFLLAKSPSDVMSALEGKVDTILLVGGGEINAAFANAGLIDEVVLTVEPYIIGQGITLFAPGEFDMKLTSARVEQLSGGRLKVSYRVEKSPGPLDTGATPDKSAKGLA